MYPEITLFSLHLQSYGLRVVIGSMAAVLWCVFAVKRLALDVNVLIDVLIAAGVGALIGAKLLYILTVLPAAYLLIFRGTTERRKRVDTIEEQ